MKNNLIQWSLIVLLAAFGAACNDDDDKTTGEPTGGEELKPVVLPTNLRVEGTTDMQAILVWDGSSTEYEVEWNGEKLPTKSISYGVEGLDPETTYSWKVRSKEGARYSEWVTGPDFTTLKLIDYTEGWPGEWEGSDFTLDLLVLGTKVPVTTFFPEEVLNQKIDVTITKKEGTIDRVFFASSRLHELLPDLPLSLEARIKDDGMSILDNLSDTLIADLEYPLSLENLPEEVAEVVTKLIEEIPLIGELFGDIQVTELGIVLQGLNLNGQLKEGNEMPVRFSVSGKFHIVTDNALINTALKLLPLTVSLDAGMTLYPKSLN